MKTASLRRTRTGYICIADHVLLWFRACAKCDLPVCNEMKVMRDAKKQNGDPQKVMVMVLGSGARLDSGRRYRWWGRLCKECASDLD